MNWTLIRDKYFKSFTEYCLFITGTWTEDFKNSVRTGQKILEVNIDEEKGILNKGIWDDFQSFDNRKCYDFFDNLGIYIIIKLSESDLTKITWDDVTIWDVLILDIKNPTKSKKYFFNSTRTEVECDAFEEAFKLLEIKNS